MLLIPKGQKVGRIAQPRENRSEHREFACAFGCAICGLPAEMHHLLRIPPEMLEHSSHDKYAGSRADDMWGIPLCRDHHIYGVHKDGNEPRYLGRFGIDGPKLAQSLWKSSGDFEMGELIIRKCWQQAQLHIVPTSTIII